MFNAQVLTPPAEPDTTGKFGGRGPQSPLVIEAWPYPDSGLPGSNDPRPIVKIPVDSNGTGLAPFWTMTGSANDSHAQEWGGDIWVIGLEITSQSIPSGPGAGWVPVAPEVAFNKIGSHGARFLLEDLYIHDVSSAFNFDGNNSEDYISGLTIRRCLVTRTWSRNLRFGFGNPQASDAGGGYIGKNKWFLFEENVMDQVGWSHLYGHPLIAEPPPFPIRCAGQSDGPEPAASVAEYVLSPKTVFNHGLYVPASTEHALVRNNIIARPSHNAIQLRGNSQRAENNLILGAPVGISLGHAQNQGPPGGETFCTTTICGGEVRQVACANPDKFWHGQCAYNVILNGANIDGWVYDYLGNAQTCDPVPKTFPLYQTTSIIINGDGRGRGITISRCRMTNDSNVSYDYCEKTKPGAAGGFVCETVKAGTVFKNLIANNDDGREAEAAGIFVDDDQDDAPNPNWIRRYEARIHDNIVYDWGGADPDGCYAVNINNSKTQHFQNCLRPFYIASSEGPLGPGFTFENNHFIQTRERAIAKARWNPVNTTLDGTSQVSGWFSNIYYSKRDHSFAHPRYRIQAAGPNQPNNAPIPAEFGGTNGWKAGSGETTSIENNMPSYPDKTRNLYTYMAFELALDIEEIKSQDEMVTKLMSYCVDQYRGNWNPDFTANAINTYMRNGFGIPAPTGGATCNACP